MSVIHDETMVRCFQAGVLVILRGSLTSDVVDNSFELVIKFLPTPTKKDKRKKKNLPPI